MRRKLRFGNVGYNGILKALQKAGGVSRLIGGCVRDALLNKTSTDIDIATTLLPEHVISVLSSAALPIKVKPIGLKHGTVTVFIANKQRFEITTLRQDLHCDGRHAQVAFTTDFTLDAARRDFTINALSYCPIETKIYDYFNGIGDLQQRKVLFIRDPKLRIKEDYLRILRFFRFSCYYADQLDPVGFNACIELQDGLHTISNERKKCEMDLIVQSNNAPYVLAQMQKSGILKQIYFIQHHSIKLRQNEFKSKPAECILIHENKQSLQNSLVSPYMNDADAIPCDAEALHIGLNFAYITKTQLNTTTRYSILFNQIHSLTINGLIALKFAKTESRQIIRMLHWLQQIKPQQDMFALKQIWATCSNNDWQQYVVAAVATTAIQPSAAQQFIITHQQLTKPIFPVTGHDLLMIGIKNQGIGSVLNNLHTVWINSNFMLNKEQLLNYLTSTKG